MTHGNSKYKVQSKKKKKNFFHGAFDNLQLTATNEMTSRSVWAVIIPCLMSYKL